MNSVESLLVDLVQMAEAPLYSAYRWLGRQLGRDLPLGEFLGLLDDLVARDVLRLWEIDHRSHDRTGLFGVPDGLEERYAAAGELDARYDPFGLSLTPGPAASADTALTWEIDFDFERGRFELLAEPDSDEDALRQAARYFPDLALMTERRESAGRRVRVVGRIDTPRS